MSQRYARRIVGFQWPYRGPTARPCHDTTLPPIPLPQSQYSKVYCNPIFIPARLKLSRYKVSIVTHAPFPHSLLPCHDTPDCIMTRPAIKPFSHDTILYRDTAFPSLQYTSNLAIQILLITIYSAQLPAYNTIVVLQYHLATAFSIAIQLSPQQLNIATHFSAHQA